MATSLCKTSVLRIYQDVIDDVISGVREIFLEEGVDEQILQELKQTWETKLKASKAVQHEVEEKPKKPTEIATTATTNGFPKQIVNLNQGVTQQQPQQQHVAGAGVQIVEAPKMVPIQITLPPQVGTDGGQRVLTIQVPATALQGNQLQKVLNGQIITATMGLPANIASSILQQHVNAVFNTQQQQQPVAVVNKIIGQTDGAHALTDDDDEEIEVEFILPSRRRRHHHNHHHHHLNVAESTSSNSNPPCKKKLLSLGKQLDGPVDSSDDDEDGSDDNDDDDDIDDDKDEEDQDMEEDLGEEEPLNSEDDVTDDDPTDLFDTDNIVVCQYDKIIRNRNKWKFYLKDGIMNLTGQDYVFQKANGDAEW